MSSIQLNVRMSRFVETRPHCRFTIRDTKRRADTRAAIALAAHAQKRRDMATVPKSNGERSESAWRGFTGGAWQTRVNLRDFIQRNYTPYEGDGSFLQGPTERTKGMWQKLKPLFAKEREKGILDVSQVPVEHPRACAGLHRQGKRDHRRPADRGAAQARDHALRRLARRRRKPRGLRLQAGRDASAKSSPSTARRTTTAYSTPTRPRSARRARRESSLACRMPTAAAASSATTAGWRSTAWISCSRTRRARSASSTTATRPRRSSACARSCPSSCAR